MSIQRDSKEEDKGYQRKRRDTPQGTSHEFMF